MRKWKLLILLFLWTGTSFGYNAKKPFSITFESFKRDQETLKVIAELKMARNTNYCRGFLMPMPAKPWSCSDTGPGAVRCEREFNCGRIRKDYSRVTETKKLRAEMRKSPKLFGKFKLVLSEEPLPNLEKYKFVNLNSIPKHMKLAKSQVGGIRGEKRVVRTGSLKDSQTKRNERGEQVGEVYPEQNDGYGNEPLRQKSIDEVFAENRRKMSPEEAQLKQDKDDFEALLDAEKQGLLESPAEKDDESEVAFLKGEQRSQKKEPKVNPLLNSPWARFTVGVVQITNDNGGSLTTFSMGYSPFIRFGKTRRWAIRPFIGGHFYERTNDADKETFLVMEGSGFITRHFRNNIYAELGFGFQKWNNSEGDLNSLIGIGVGYTMVKKLFSVFDGLALNYRALSSDDKAKELKFSLGISF